MELYKLHFRTCSINFCPLKNLHLLGPKKPITVALRRVASRWAPWGSPRWSRAGSSPRARSPRRRAPAAPEPKVSATKTGFGEYIWLIYMVNIYIYMVNIMGNRAWFLCPVMFHITQLLGMSTKDICFGDVKQIPKKGHLPNPWKKWHGIYQCRICVGLEGSRRWHGYGL